MPESAKVVVRLPCAALRPFVKRFLVVEYPTGHRDMHLPDTGLVAAFQFRGESLLYGKIKAPQAGLTGLWDQMRVHEHSESSGIVVAAFTPTGASALLHHPMDAFFNTTLVLDDIVDGRGELNRTSEQLAEAGNHASRIQAVENYLLGCVSSARVPDRVVSACVMHIQKVHGVVQIEDLARNSGLSQRTLERRFRTEVGASPRKFASIVRLRHVLRLHKMGGNFTSIAVAAGYCDQSHFIKDFKQITGFAPKSYFHRSHIRQSR